MTQAHQPIHERIKQRLSETGKSMRQASIDAGLSESTVSQSLRKPLHSQTLATIEKLAHGLETSAAWLAYGVGDFKDRICDANQLCIDRGLFRQVIEFVLVHEGVEKDRAAVISDILPEALEGSLFDAVERDPLVSFRIHFQIGSERQSQR